jgi:hypothetical protein
LLSKSIDHQPVLPVGAAVWSVFARTRVLVA